MRDFPLMMAVEDGISGSSTSVDSDINELNDESTVTETEEEEVQEEEEEEETPEEEPSEEPEEEQAETPALHPFDRPSLKNINEAYPDFFKKFPSMRDMYFREAEYSKLFPTVDDAKEASENNAAFTNIKDDIFNGDGNKFMTAVNSVDPKGLEKFSGHFLSNLSKLNMSAFWKAANPLIEDVSKAMYNKGRMDGDDNIKNAALHLSQFFFGRTDIAEGKGSMAPREEPESDLEREKRDWEDRKHLEFRGSIEGELRGQLDDLVIGLDERTGKSKLDPDGLLSPFIKQTIVDHVVADIGAALSGDTAHLRYMDSLWARAKTNGRRDSDKQRIISAYLSRARAMAPALRSKYVSEALGRRARAAGEKVKKVESIPPRTANVGRAGSNGRADYNPKKIDYRKTSDSDILNDDIKYKD